MKRLHKFVLLSQSQRNLLLSAATLMYAFRMGLWLLPFRTLACLTEHFGSWSRAADALTAERIAWSIQVASRYVPKASCLVQALTAKILLQSAGIPVRLHIGVAKMKGQPFEAHAWVETRGGVLIGGSELERYAPLLVWERGSGCIGSARSAGVGE